MITDLFSYDEKKIADIKIIGDRDEGDFFFREIGIPCDTKNSLTTAYYLKPKQGGKHPCILYSHWLANKPDANKTEFVTEAKHLSAHGFACLLVDTVFANWPKSRMKWKGDDFTHDKELVVSQVRELRLFLSWMRRQPETDSLRTALVGHDFGAMFNAIVAGIDKDIKACVMMAAIPDFTDWFTMRKKISDGELKKYCANMSDLAPVRHLEMATGVSFLFQFGKKDKSFVPKEKAEALFEKAGGDKEIHWYEEGHALHLCDAATEYRVDWLKRQLG